MPLSISLHHSVGSVAVLGTFPPRRCGIATFTSDLASAVRAVNPSVPVDIVAANDRPYDYSKEVAFQLEQDDPDSYLRAAAFLNHGKYDVLSVQHEYGIFGGIAGEHLLQLLRAVNVPIVTTLHTVLRHPNEAQWRVLDEVLRLSERVVVMSKSAIALLSLVHRVDESKIDYIPHGVPTIPEAFGDGLRSEIGGAGPVLLTFGLLSPDKGIDTVIRAMPGILEKCPEAQYIVVGVTHPHERERNGETYRESLEELAVSLGVRQHVTFVNEFVSLERITEYLSAADYYVTPSLNPIQITSGTLAYSMAAGKIIISTPYTYAQELLAEGRGVLVPFGESEPIVATVVESWARPHDFADMRAKARRVGQEMSWEFVGKQYVLSFERAAEAFRHFPAVLDIETVASDTDVSLDHLKKLTDDTGIIQHATYSVPNRAEGYCVDDNARALILTTLLESSSYASPTVEKLQATYLSFVVHAFNESSGRFRNFMSYDRKWLEVRGSEDSQGRSLWALGTLIAQGRDKSHVRLAEATFVQAMPGAALLRSPRACAYAVLGAAHYAEARPGNVEALQLVKNLGEYLKSLYGESSRPPAWPWMEARLSYANARIPQAMIRAGEVLRDQAMISMGLTSLSWLMDNQVSSCGAFSPAGTAGVGPDTLGSVQFDQQPVEAWSSLSACLTASRFAHREKYVDRAHQCFAWFHGRNVVRARMASSITGSCFDGLHRTGVNNNQGAESTLSYLCSSLELGQAVESKESRFGIPVGKFSATVLS